MGIPAGNAENKLKLNNYYSETQPYLRPYLNIQRLTGVAQCGVVSADEESSQWIYEAAQQDTTSAAAAQEFNVPLNIFTDTNIYKLLYNNEYLESLYQLEYYSNTVRIRYEGEPISVL